GVDEGLFSVDFRASERLAQLVVQVAGRAGRARKPGRVILQTHQPEHPLLRGLLARGYATTARELLAERQAVALPPYGYQALLRAEALKREDVDGFLAAGRQRGQLLLEAPRRASLHAILRPWWLALHELPAARRVRWSIDVDPIDLY